MTDGISIVLGSAVLAGLLLVTGTSQPLAKQPMLESAKVAEVRKGYRAGWLVGNKVSNEQNETVGAITEFVVSQDYALFVVLDVGVFLGLGTQLVAVPVRALVFKDAGRKVMLPGATRKALRNFPEFKFPD
jgi:hypothetical protein